MHRRCFEGTLLTRTSNIVPAVIHPQLSYTSHTTKQLSPEAALSAPFQVQGNMVRISDEVEINRSPADVRAVVRTPRVSSFLLLVLTELCMTALNFPSWPEWLKNGLVMTSERKAGPELKQGDKLKSNFNGIKAKPVVVVCSHPLGATVD